MDKISNFIHIQASNKANTNNLWTWSFLDSIENMIKWDNEAQNT